MDLVSFKSIEGVHDATKSFSLVQREIVICERSHQYPISSDASKRSLQRECYSTVEVLAMHGLFANFSFYALIQAISERMTRTIAYPIHQGTGTFPSPGWQG
jgi:hypothetical protein